MSPAKVTAKMFSVDENSDPMVVTNGTESGKLAVNSEGRQECIVPFNKHSSIVATLVQLGNAPAEVESIIL